MNMGFWPFSGSSNDPQSVGLSVLRGYFNEALNFSEFGYTDFDVWLSSLKARVSDVVELIGDLVIMNYASTTVDEAIERVQELASLSMGQASIPSIVSAAGGKGDSVNWVAGIPEITIQTGYDAIETVSEAAANVGQGVLGTLNMTKYLPWILLGAGALFIYSQGGTLKSMLGKFKS